MTTTRGTDLAPAEQQRVQALSDDPQWYKDAVIYQVHVRGFFDSNGDGVGDFAGLPQKLDYIQSLGVSAIWLQPFYPSPLRDDGYDIAHYEGVHPSYGTRRDFRTFLDAAHDRGLRVDHRAGHQPHVRSAPVVSGGAPGASPAHRSATSTSGATPTSATPACGSSSRTPSARTGRGIRSPARTTGTGSFTISPI